MKKLNPNQYIRSVLNKMAERNKENKNDKEMDGDDEVRAIIVDKCFFYPPRNNLPLTVGGFFRSFHIGFSAY